MLLTLSEDRRVLVVGGNPAHWSSVCSMSVAGTQ